MYVCSPDIFEYIPDATKFDFAKNLFPLLMEKGMILDGWLARETGQMSEVPPPFGLLRSGNCRR
jgi:mannose-1-phosphate guanylyltransferase